MRYGATMTCHSTMLQLTLVAAVGLATVGCQSMAVAMDDPLAYDSGPAQPAGMNAYCSSMARDAAAWGTLPSALCTPYGPPMYWSGPTGAYPYFYGRPSGRTWRGSGWGQYRSHPGRGTAADGVAAGAAAAETNAASRWRTRAGRSSHSTLDNERGSRYTVLHSRGHLSLELL